MIKGIFLWDSSLIAICNASVSPSRGTRTGAFILTVLNNLSRGKNNDIPYLQCPSTQDTSTLVLSKIRRRYSDFVWLPFTRQAGSSWCLVAITHFLILIYGLRAIYFRRLSLHLRSFLCCLAFLSQKI